jgi:hypothetical protein
MGDREWLLAHLVKIQKELDSLEAKFGRIPFASQSPSDDPTGQVAWTWARYHAEEGLKCINFPILQQMRRETCAGWVDIALAQGRAYQASERQAREAELAEQRRKHSEAGRNKPNVKKDQEAFYADFLAELERNGQEVEKALKYAANRSTRYKQTDIRGLYRVLAKMRDGKS